MFRRLGCYKIALRVSDNRRTSACAQKPSSLRKHSGKTCHLNNLGLPRECYSPESPRYSGMHTKVLTQYNCILPSKV
jgi:hypothetical protein